MTQMIKLAKISAAIQRTKRQIRLLPEPSHARDPLTKAALKARKAQLKQDLTDLIIKKNQIDLNVDEGHFGHQGQWEEPDPKRRKVLTNQNFD